MTIRQKCRKRMQKRMVAACHRAGVNATFRCRRMPWYRVHVMDCGIFMTREGVGTAVLRCDGFDIGAVLRRPRQVWMEAEAKYQWRLSGHERPNG